MASVLAAPFAPRLYSAHLRKGHSPVALVVEPQSELSAVLVQALEAIGLTVIATSTHATAARMAPGLSPLLLVSSLPPAGQCADQDRLAASCPKHTRTILLASDQAQASSLPDDAVVLWKPFGWQELRSAVEWCLQCRAESVDGDGEARS